MDELLFTYNVQYFLFISLWFCGISPVSHLDTPQKMDYLYMTHVRLGRALVGKKFSRNCSISLCSRNISHLKKKKNHILGHVTQGCPRWKNLISHMTVGRLGRDLATQKFTPNPPISHCFPDVGHLFKNSFLYYVTLRMPKYEKS